MIHEVITDGIDVENMTIEQAVYLHRMMWYGIARKIRRKRRTVNVEKEKRRFCDRYFSDRVICSDCFCCEYAIHLTDICIFCPVKWDTGDMLVHHYMCESDYNDNMNWIECCRQYFEYKGAWRRQLEMAQNIADAPINWRAKHDD